jgi:uncharacterized membrane protein YcaP (DUF421 family)
MKRFYELIGEGADAPTPSQMAIRAGIIFIVALILIRFSGRRWFGQSSPFDNVITILLGAVLSRAVVKSDISFFAPIAGAFVVAMLHFVFAYLSLKSDKFGRLVKGDARILFKDGKRNLTNMRATYITEKDFIEGIRKAGSVKDESEIDEVWIERDGSISVVKKNGLPITDTRANL